MLGTKSKTRLSQLIKEMVCEVTGGPAKYIGQDMRTAHLGLGITGSDWQVAVKNLTAALDIERTSTPRTEVMFISDYSLPLCWRYTAINTAKSAIIVPIASNPGDFGACVVGWSFASPGKVRLCISCRFV